MPISFNEFIESFSPNSAVNNKDGEYIYNNIICNDSNRINFIQAINKKIPPLAVCVKEIEEYYLNSYPKTLDLTNHAVKQSIGRMIKKSLEPLDYVPYGSKRIKSKYFSTAATYIKKESLK
ncbi:hypothetical protein [Clostridium tarantellae]|uniref:Uncharacterized protein n=1 Tax=Clostridium tarantellae TaxID=39493 RepID=A0A6I1MKQ0_9CLOT|nr:hypothetical protein [Clostridium tarantellae]MPQ43554.1 hypothetical protein [Clostridium tarantellae]